MCSASPQFQAGPVLQLPEASRSLTIKLSRPLLGTGVAGRERRQADKHATNRSRNLGQHPKLSFAGEDTGGEPWKQAVLGSLEGRLKPEVKTRTVPLWQAPLSHKGKRWETTPARASREASLGELQKEDRPPQTSRAGTRFRQAHQKRAQRPQAARKAREVRAVAPRLPCLNTERAPLAGRKRASEASLPADQVHRPYSRASGSHKSRCLETEASRIGPRPRPESAACSFGGAGPARRKSNL